MEHGQLLFEPRNDESESAKRPEDIELLIQESGNRFVQFAAALSVSLVTMGFATSEFWTSPALPYLQKNNSEFVITVDQGSWTTSLFDVGLFFGYLLYPLLVDRIGRKKTLLICGIVQLLSAILIYIAKNIIVLYLARLLGGIGYSAGYSVEVIYLGEIAEQDIRGLITFIGTISGMLGSIIILTAGAFCTYDMMNLIVLEIPLLFIATFLFMPESPYFYLKLNREDDAIKSLSKLRGTNDQRKLNFEVNMIKEVIIEGQRCEQFALKTLFQNRRCRKALLIALLLSLGEVLSGADVIISYGEKILNFSEFFIAAEYSTIILQLIVFLCVLPSAPLVDYLGRRLLTFWSCIICALSLATVGLFFFLKNYLQIKNLSSISWMPLVALIVYKVSSNAGFNAVKTVMSAELFPIEIKSTALCLLYIVGDAVAFLVQLWFENSVIICGVYGVFWIYGIFCLVLPLIAFCIMPETKGKSLEEIQMLLD